MKAKHLNLNKIQQIVFVLILIATLPVSASAQAAEGTLDPTFGANGVVTTDLGNSDSVINIVLQPDGKIVMAANTGDPYWGNPILIRYNVDGTLDTTFGTGGIVTAALQGPVALQTDGKLIVGGNLNGGLGLARYTGNGALDTTFGTNGIAVAVENTDPNSNAAISFDDLAVQPDGKIVVVGTEEFIGGHTVYYVIVRFNENGTQDEDFGIVFDEFPDGMQSHLRAVALQSGARIIFTGRVHPYNTDTSIGIGRIPPGPYSRLDPTFGTDGTVLTELPHFSHDRGSLAIQPDDKIVIAGTMHNYSDDTEDLAVVRHTSNGVLDTTLGGNGVVTTDLGQNESGNDLAIQKDGKIVVAGESHNQSEGSSAFLLLRYNNDGSIDTTFGDAGKIISNFGGSSASATAVAIQPDGKIVIAGSKDGDILLARYSGTPVPATTTTFRSRGPHDGWILESLESSNLGGTLNKTATTFNVGDDQRDRQYRSIISFNTDSLPDNAFLTSVQVRIRRQGLVGIDPFTTHGNLLLEIRNGLFSNDLDVSLSDFAAASSSNIPDTFAIQTDGWYSANLNGANLAFVNKYGVTQFRLRFDLDDNDDLNSDYMKFFSGDATYEADYPQLIVTYVVP
ncbi:MAG TPA: hypothetical protein VFQ13_09805 [Anaerolineales bacterium]|nr:hypothetical protein [Anaerolineales bacterium]